MLRACVLAAALAVGFIGAGAARADVVRFHYAPAPCNGHTTLKVNPDGAAGEWRPWSLGLRRSSYYCQPRATHMVTFVHPFTGKHVTVPIAFPQGTARILYQSDSVMYSYTGYWIRVDFLRDGSVDVVYNSGLLRPL